MGDRHGGKKEKYLLPISKSGQADEKVAHVDTTQSTAPSNNLFVFETALRSSYRAGFRDALKLSPFMPFTPPGSSEDHSSHGGSLPLSPPHTDGRIKALSGNAVSGGSWTTEFSPVNTPLILLSVALAGTATVLSYRSIQRFRSLERRLDKSLSSIWQMDSNTSESLRKLHAEMKMIRGVVLDQSPLIGLREKSEAKVLGGQMDELTEMVKRMERALASTAGGNTIVGPATDSTPSTPLDARSNLVSDADATRTTNALNPAKSLGPLTSPQDHYKSINTRLNGIQESLQRFVDESDDHWRAVFTLEELVGSMDGKIDGVADRVKEVQSALTELQSDRVAQSEAWKREKAEEWEEENRNDRAVKNPADTRSAAQQPIASAHELNKVVPQQASSSKATGQAGPAHNTSTHVAPEIMPLHEIQKAVQGIKESFLEDREAESAKSATSGFRADTTSQVSAEQKAQSVSLSEPPVEEAASERRPGAEATGCVNGSAIPLPPPPSSGRASTGLPDVSERVTNFGVDTSGFWTISPYVSSGESNGSKIVRGAWPPESWFPIHWGHGEERLEEITLHWDEHGWLEPRMTGRNQPKRPTSYNIKTKLCGSNQPSASRAGRMLEIFVDGRWWIVKNEPLCDTYEDRWTIRERLPADYTHEGWIDSAERVLSRYWVRFTK